MNGISILVGMALGTAGTIIVLYSIATAYERKRRRSEAWTRHKTRR